MKKRLLLLSILIIALLSPTVNSADFFDNGKNLYSRNVYMVNTDTGKTVYELDSEELVYPASLTKIMTCILAIEKCEDLNEIFVIPSSSIFNDIYADNGVNMQLKTGEEITVGDLLHATMISSMCDSATALAYYVAGGVDEFAELMNAKALEIGTVKTHFVNAHGLHNENHYTTAKDMYLITEYALKNPVFCDIISKYEYTVPVTNKSPERKLTTTMFVENPESDAYYPHLTGIKSGFTDQAGRCLITKATKDGESYILVTMGANLDGYYTNNMAFTDAVTLFEYYFAQYSLEDVVKDGDNSGEAPIEKGAKESVPTAVSGSLTTLVPINAGIQSNVIYDEDLTAPIKAGDKVGTLEIIIEDEKYSLDVVALESVDRKSDKIVLADLNGGNAVATAIDIGSAVMLGTTAIISIIFIIRIIKANKH